MKSKTITWPLAYSNKQAAEYLGWPVPFIAALKRAGCPAYSHGRWNLAELVAWVPTHFLGDEIKIDWGRELKKAQALREQLRLQEEQRAVVPLAEVRRDLSAGLSYIFDSLERVFLNELPALCKGMDEYGIRAAGKKHIEVFRNALLNKWKSLNENQTNHEKETK